MDAVRTIFDMAKGTRAVGPDEVAAWIAWHALRPSEQPQLAALLRVNPTAVREAFRGACEVAAVSSRAVNFQALRSVGKIIRLLCVPDTLPQPPPGAVVVGPAAMLYDISSAETVVRAATHTAQLMENFRQTRTRRWIGETVIALAWATKLPPGTDNAKSNARAWKCTRMTPTQLSTAAGRSRAPDAALTAPPAVLAADPSACWHIIKACCIHNFMPFDRFVRQVAAYIAGGSKPQRHQTAFVHVWITALASPEAKEAVQASTLRATIALSALIVALTKQCHFWTRVAQAVNRELMKTVPPACYSDVMGEAAFKLSQAGTSSFIPPTMDNAVIRLPWIYRISCHIALFAARNPTAATAWHYFCTAIALPSAERILRQHSYSAETPNLAWACHKTDEMLRMRHPISCAARILLQNSAQPVARLRAIQRIAYNRPALQRQVFIATTAVLSGRSCLPPELLDIIIRYWLARELLQIPF